MRHQELALHWVLKPGTVGFGRVQVPAMWVWDGFKSQPCGFESQSEVKAFKSIPVSIDIGYVSDHRQLKQKSSENSLFSIYFFIEG